MKVAVVGATGNTGQRLTAELLKRRHQVRAIVRSPEKVSPAKGLEVVKSDLSDITQLADVLNGVDAVVSAYRPPDNDTRSLTLRNALRKASSETSSGSWSSAERQVCSLRLV